MFSSWALNEVTVEKASRERMLELTVAIDGRPLSTWGCDGIVMATPTGSTAYAFSAGGPVVWPDVEALLLVPISAHALFARPVVVGPQSRLVVEVLARTQGSGVVWCDGRRAVDLPPGARIEVHRSDQPVRLARLSHGGFTDRLVEKFRLPVQGWRGPAGAMMSDADRDDAPVIEEIRIRDLGVIDEAVLSLHPGLTVLTGETGAGKTMVVTGLGLLLGGRGDSALVRAGADRVVVEGVVDLPAGHPALVRAAEAGADVGDGLVLVRSVSADGRSRAHVGGRAAPVGVLAELAEHLVAVHGQADQWRLRRADQHREVLDGFGGREVAEALAAYRALHVELTAAEAELAHLRTAAAERAREAEALRVGLERIEALDPQPGEDAALRHREPSGSATPRSCAPAPAPRTPPSPVTTTPGCRRRACSRRSPPRRPGSRR